MDMDEAKQPRGREVAQDRISNLCDDVLLRILELVAAADVRDAARAGELSRRWRGLWMRAPSLRFDTTQWHGDGEGLGPQPFIAFVDGSLARRSQQQPDADVAALERLDIYFAMGLEEEHEQYVAAAAERWIRYASQHELKSFRLKFEIAMEDEEYEGSVISLDDLPSSAKLETLSLEMENARVRLPATAVFASLVDLTLQSIEVQGDSDGSGERLLTRLFSSACCPQLRKLDLWGVHVQGARMEELVIDAPALTHLTLRSVGAAWSLRLVTPALRVLLVHFCYLLQEITLSSSPRLEEIACTHNRSLIHVHGDMSSVSSLEIYLYLHDDHQNHLSVWLLQRCKQVRRLQVSIDDSTPTKTISHSVDTIKDRIQQLPQVMHLKVSISNGWKCHSTANSVASLLSKFTNLRYLHLDFDHIDCCDKKSELSPDHVCNHWESLEFSSAHLQEVAIKGVIRTNCELGFLQFLLAGATQLRKVVVRNDRWLNHLEDQRNCSLHQRLLGHGIWTDWHEYGCNLSCEWKAC